MRSGLYNIGSSNWDFGSTNFLVSQFLLLCHVPSTGFHGGGTKIPLPEILKLSMVIIVLSQVLSNNLVPDCNLRGSFFGRACPQIPLVGTHLRVHERAFAALSSCYHPIPPPQPKILYETLVHSASPLSI